MLESLNVRIALSLQNRKKKKKKKLTIYFTTPWSRVESVDTSHASMDHVWDTRDPYYFLVKERTMTNYPKMMVY